MKSDIFRTLEFPKIIALVAGRTHCHWGREIAEQLQPSDEFDTVQRLLDETDAARTLLTSELTVPFGGISDIRSALKRAELGSVLDPEEIAAVGNTISAVRRLKAFFDRIEISLFALEPYILRLASFKLLENKIDEVIDEQARIRDNASVELSRLRRGIREQQGLVKTRLDSILRSVEYQKYFQEAIVTVRGDRYVVPVKQEYRHHFPGIIHDQSGSGATVFIEPMAIVNINNDIKQLAAAEKHEVERLLTVLSSRIGQDAAAILDSCENVAILDAIFARALLSLDMRAYRPELSRAGHLNLVNARHPLIDPSVVVPISVRLGQDFRTLLITGPNTGGKTVTLKLVGLFSLMTQSGLFLPAMAESVMPVFRNIFVDIGDEQSIEQSLSTFSAHMKHMVDILAAVTADDLVLVDEIGAGTDPDEGAALAMAILAYLQKKGCQTIVTTHYSELKTFAFSHEGIENASVEFDVETLRPTYRLIMGMAGSSNAFAISKRLGLQSELIEQAKELMDQSHADFEGILAKLEEQTLEFTKRNEEMTVLKQELTSLRTKLAREQETANTRRKALLDKSKNEAALIVRQARRTAEEVINELKAQFSENQQKIRQQKVQQARQKLSAELGDLNFLGDIDDDRPVLLRDKVTLGMTVFVPSLNQKGVVLDMSHDDLVLQMGIMKMTVPMNDCRMAAQPARESRTYRRTKPSKISPVTSVTRQIDVRGTTVDEAIEVIDKFLDEALLAGLNEVLVIHGKGTGALRHGLREHLKQHPSVNHIAIAEMNEGGDGATSVKLV
ncbi:DNA mismatch repair protein MutS2 [Sporomusaceae bacterium BoRhaA]|uniref:endonuclease MutS2 n=1 Tax=Pelorhabdus rhamnosifermentans TaxID=2772457 RepID=UPI001C06241A|nr:endonuclease MutS2 [Pelorhabdus rhamnosifermentans]MBU2701561.1 DNA mismatch repair protein MutS2 [Pelorhabdus rhamnosifermentans]